MSNTFYLKAQDGHKIFVRCWPVMEPKAFVQIIHGMNEHSERYDKFARFLNQEGFYVAATDHRGHGRSATNPEKIGYIEENGFEKMVNDEKLLFSHLQSQFFNTPHFILGHSMGSFIAQRYIQKYAHEINGSILIGSGGKRPELEIGAAIAGIFERYTDDKRIKNLEKLIFAGYNRRFNKQTGFEWLANDTEVVDSYLKDPFCAHVFPPSFYRQFLNFLNMIFQDENVSKVPTSLPIYILSGANDPVGQFGKGVKRLYDQYEQRGSKDLQYKLYPDGRHEILNDFDKLLVYQDILAWINNHLD